MKYYQLSGKVNESLVFESCYSSDEPIIGCPRMIGNKHPRDLVDPIINKRSDFGEWNRKGKLAPIDRKPGSIWRREHGTRNNTFGEMRVCVGYEKLATVTGLSDKVHQKRG